MNEQIIQELENMSEQELQQLLATDFGPELEKEAAAELAQGDLAESLYAYGAHMAVREVESTEELSKEAAAELDKEYQEVTGSIEQALIETGLLESDDTVELHKEAQAAAGIIFAGYSDTIEKLAGEKMEKVKAALKNVKGKHAAMGAGGLAALGAGAYAYKKNHEKKASEVTASEMAQIMREEQEVDAVIAEGINKLAKVDLAKAKEIGGKMAAKAKELGGKAVEGAKKHKAAIGAGAGGLALGGLAGRMSKKNKKD